MRPFPIFASLLITFSAQAAQAYTEGDVPAAKLLEAVKQGTIFPETKNAFQHDMEKPKNTSMYGLKNATTWTADFDVDCDGTETANCNKKRDPWFQNQLSIGVNLKADEVPYFVIPISSPSNSSKRDIQFGQIAALIFNDQVVFAVFVDECGVSSLIGEGSYAAAKLLGIDPDPNTGGSDGPATFLVFTGPTGRITDRSLYTNHQKAIEIATSAHSLDIFDTQGRNAFSREGRGPWVYDLTGLKAGLYTVKLATPGKVQTSRLAYFP